VESKAGSDERGAYQVFCHAPLFFEITPQNPTIMGENEHQQMRHLTESPAVFPRRISILPAFCRAKSAWQVDAVGEFCRRKKNIRSVGQNSLSSQSPMGHCFQCVFLPVTIRLSAGGGLTEAPLTFL
jgi:hypothetical protein